MIRRGDEVMSPLARRRFVVGGIAAVLGRAVWRSAPAWASPDVPPVGEAARAAGLVDVRTVVPDAVIDLRYATTHNFTGVQLYPSDARCLVHESLAPGLKTAADT